jgi:chromosome segregation ATPase
LATMDEQALERAKRRIADARAGRTDTARFEAALERSRAQIEQLARAADELELALPERVGHAVQEGLRREVVPVGRNLAEIRGLLNGVNRRLERLEQEIGAERHARIDDLALLVDLVASGWQSVDDRLSRLETASDGRVVQLPHDAAAA